MPRVLGGPGVGGTRSLWATLRNPRRQTDPIGKEVTHGGIIRQPWPSEALGGFEDGSFSLG